MAGFLIDSNIILDIATADKHWQVWSAETLAAAAESGFLAINPIIYAEVSAGYEHIEDCDHAVPPEIYHRLPLPWEAGFLAGKCFVRYRRAGGGRRSPLPDFYIGAHAAVRGLTLVTRETRRYEYYFPKLKIICPK